MKELKMRQKNHVFLLDSMLLLWEGKVYTQTVPDGDVVGKAQPKLEGHVVVIARTILTHAGSNQTVSLVKVCGFVCRDLSYLSKCCHELRFSENLVFKQHNVCVTTVTLQISR